MGTTLDASQERMLGVQIPRKQRVPPQWQVHDVQLPGERHVSYVQHAQANVGHDQVQKWALPPAQELFEVVAAAEPAVLLGLYSSS